MISEAVKEHAAKCDAWDGYILEDAIVTCTRKAANGSKMDWRTDDDEVALVRRICMGCSETIELGPVQVKERK